MRDPQHLGRILDTLVGLRALDAAHLEAEAHVLAHGLVRIERIVLKHHGDVALARRQRVHDLIADAHLARGHAFETRHHAQRRGLAAAGRADKHDQFAIGNIQIDAFDDLGTAIALSEPAQADRCHAVRFLPSDIRESAFSAI